MHWEAYLDHSASSASGDVFLFLYTQMPSYSSDDASILVDDPVILIVLVPDFGVMWKP